MEKLHPELNALTDDYSALVSRLVKLKDNMEFWSAFANAIVGLISACIGAYYTLWLQSRKERIKRRDDKTLYVELSAIKRDHEGFYIPGYGRIVNTKPESHGEPKENELPGIVNGNKNIAYICCERTPGMSMIPHYVISSIVPL